MIKKHLEGGSLRVVMVEEVIRVMRMENNIDRAAVHLGITPRTLRVWLAKWPELEGLYKGATETLMGTKPKPKLKRSRKVKLHGSEAQTNQKP